MVVKKEYCDICGNERQIFPKSMLVAFHGTIKHERSIDICEYCSNEFEERMRHTQIEFILKSNWWKENATHNGDIDYGDFHMVGTSEQGGYSCPRCGHCNNAYTFENKCQACGYEKE